MHPFAIIIFHSLNELESRLFGALGVHNNAYKRKGHYRRQFIELEQATLMALPSKNYQFKNSLYQVHPNGHAT
jgi:hypothetical protein